MENQTSLDEGGALFEKRAHGHLPHIDIAGTDFTIDWRLKELLETAAPWNAINLRDIETSELDQYLFFYDTVCHNVHEVDYKLTKLPENVVVAELPDEIKLDPFAVAREQGVDPVIFVQDFPIQKDLKAIIKPLTESGLPVFVSANLLFIASQNKNKPTEEQQPQRGHSR
ncbi:hypothetical protein [Mucilaginibacter sp. UYCu711]|uniref:hypothetical protein n=1 Tax=Mucilaginibacter sp. UYCu711 TaxID=3156339 RepID=UPI003D1D58C1